MDVTTRLHHLLAPTETGGHPALDKFAEKYRQYFPRVFAYVYGRVRNPHLAEDIVSEVFERAFVKAHSLRNEEAYGTWLFTIARNILANYGRRQARQGQTLDSEILDGIPHGGASVESEILLREELGVLVAHLGRLSQKEQDIIALKFDGELSSRQIASIMGISEGNVRVLLYRTLRKLRDLMAHEGRKPGRRD